MSILQSDLLWFSSLSAALADIRKNKFLLVDAYSNMLSDPYLKESYGQKEIDNFVAFIDRKISIFTEHRLPDAPSFPAIVIKIGPGEEDRAKDALGDSFQTEQVNPATLGGVYDTPTILIGPTTPVNYNVMTGQVTFGPDVNLSTSHIFEGQYVYDEVNNKYYCIDLVIDSSNLLLEPGLNPAPNLTGMTIRPIKNLVGHVRRSIWAYEKVDLELYATDAVEVLYLYTIVMTMLIRYKKVLWEARNWAISVINYGPLVKIMDENDPNKLYCRSLSIQGRVEHSAIESTKPLIQGVSTQLKIADMSTPLAFLGQAEAQSWDGEGDP